MAITLMSITSYVNSIGVLGTEKRWESSVIGDKLDSKQKDRKVEVIRTGHHDFSMHTLTGRVGVLHLCVFTASDCLCQGGEIRNVVPSVFEDEPLDSGTAHHKP
jgi:hypothetical protein